MRLWPQSIPRAMRTSAFAVVGAGILIVATVLIVFYQERSYRAQKLQEVVAQADVLAHSVAAALVFDDPKAAQEYVSALKGYPELDVAAVYDSSNRVFASVTRAAAVAVPAHAGHSSSYYADDQVFATIPVAQNGTTVGKVYLRVTIDSPMARIVRYLGIVLLVTMAVLMLSVLGIVQQALSRTNTKLKEEMAERARVEEALRQSQKMEALGQLAGGVAHDFNNLLAIIRGSVQLMMRRLGTVQPDVQRFADAAMNGVDRAAQVTQRILAFSRQQTLSQKPVDLTRLVEGMLPLIRQSVGRTIDVNLHLTADWLTFCDVNQMENVILNLAINARDAMPEGGRLTIETSNAMRDPAETSVSPGEYVCLRMRDTGIGMNETVRARAFDPFFTTKDPGKGTGLGLSMALGFVNQSNGYVSIDSELGKGTAITILMPRMIEAKSPEVSHVPA